MYIPKNKFHTKISLKYLGGDNYEVKKDIVYTIFGGTIVVPKGFVTDLASIPKMLERFIDRKGNHSAPSILHDYLYSEYSEYDLNKKEADIFFLEGMKKCGVGYPLRHQMFMAVDVFGEPHYKKKKLNGNKPCSKKALIDTRKCYKEHIKNLYKEFPKYIM